MSEPNPKTIPYLKIRHVTFKGASRIFGFDIKAYFMELHTEEGVWEEMYHMPTERDAFIRGAKAGLASQGIMHLEIHQTEEEQP
jgi:hypothetical protein